MVVTAHDDGTAEQTARLGNSVAVARAAARQVGMDPTEFERLRAAGDIDPASAPIDDLPEPIVVSVDGPNASEVLRRLRHDER